MSLRRRRLPLFGRVCKTGGTIQLSVSIAVGQYERGLGGGCVHINVNVNKLINLAGAGTVAR